MGVTLMNLADGDTVVAVARGGESDADEEDDEAGEASPETAPVVGEAAE